MTRVTGVVQGAFEVDGKPVPAWGALYVATTNMADAALDQASQGFLFADQVANMLHSPCLGRCAQIFCTLQADVMLRLRCCRCAARRWTRRG